MTWARSPRRHRHWCRPPPQAGLRAPDFLRARAQEKAKARAAPAQGRPPRPPASAWRDCRSSSQVTPLPRARIRAQAPIGSFRRFEQQRRAGTELLEQSRLIRLGGNEMMLLDVAEAANFFRDYGETDGEMMVFRRKPRQHLVEHRCVIFDQLAFGAAFQRPAERIERRAAQYLQFRQKPESRKEPRPKAHFARQAGRLVTAGQQWRREMK